MFFWLLWRAKLRLLKYWSGSVLKGMITDNGLEFWASPSTFSIVNIFLPNFCVDLKASQSYISTLIFTILWTGICVISLHRSVPHQSKEINQTEAMFTSWGLNRRLLDKILKVHYCSDSLGQLKRPELKEWVSTTWGMV